MKKIIFILICFFSSLYIVNAENLISEPLPYYVKIKKGSNPEKIIQVNKIYDKDSLNAVFSVDYLNYDTSNSFKTHSEYNRTIWKHSTNSVNLFNSIVYYGYNSKQSDLYYFLTQVVIWNLINGATVTISDEFGNEIKNYYNEWSYVFNTPLHHSSKALFFTEQHDVDLWSTNKLTYDISNLILDNPDNSNFEFVNEGRNLYITAKEVGNYSLVFSKTYEQETYCYSDGINTYWQSLKGPSNVSHTLIYNVKGIKLNIKENLIGVNNRFGDALLNSTYELYLDNELKQVITDFNDLNIKNNSNYILKDISNNKGINNIEDISFQVKEDEYILEIDKYVISKNISLDIQSNKDYNVYLKSNNELYETINNSTDMITLPYGIYYIKDQDNTFYQEIKVEDDIDEILIIKEKIPVLEEEVIELPKEELDSKIETENETSIVDKSENSNKEEIIEEIKKEDNMGEDISNIENPQTLDDINYYILSFFLSLMLLIILIKVTPKVN